MFNKKLLIHSKNVDEIDTETKSYESLRYYAMNKVPDYSTITELPQSAIDYLNMVIPTDMLGCFMGCAKLKNIDLSGLTDVSQVSDFTGCFQTCTELLSITIPQWDLSNVTSTNAMFYSCTKLQDLSFVSNWNVSKVTNMGGMFAFCRGISSINLTSWDTSKVLNFYYFIGDTYITSLDLSNFNTASATDLTYMFAGSSIRNLDISIKKVASWAMVFTLVPPHIVPTLKVVLPGRFETFISYKALIIFAAWAMAFLRPKAL